MKKLILPLTLSLLLLGTAAFAAWQTDRLHRAARALDEVHLQALNQSVEEMQSLTLHLEKLLVAATPAHQAALLHAAALAAADVHGALSTLPAADGALADTLLFLGALQEDASGLLPALTQGALTPSQRDELTQARNACAQLSGQLALARSDVSASRLSAIAYPQAEVRLPAAPRGLPDGEITREQARDIARAFVGDESASVRDAPDASGVLPAYGVTVESGGVPLNLEITRQGGKVLWMMPETASFPMTQSPEDCEAAALRFLKDQGFGRMQTVHRQLYDGLCVISAVPVQEDVLLYPDLVSVQVRMDTLQVVGLEARSYWTYHVPRQIPSPALTAQEARALLAPELEPVAEALCIIPAGSAERLCWQCTALARGETYYIYLDAQTGQEVTIRKLIPLENGSTAA